MLTKIHDIQNVLRRVGVDSFYDSVTNLVKALGYWTARQLDLQLDSPESFRDVFDSSGRLVREEAHFGEWEEVTLVCQLTNEDLCDSNLDTRQVVTGEVGSYLFIALQLDQEYYEKWELEDIAAQVNRVFMTPVFLIILYGHKVSVAICDRRANKRDQDKDVLENVHMLYNVSTTSPAQYHIDALVEMSRTYIQQRRGHLTVATLHRDWADVLDSTRALISYNGDECISFGNIQLDAGAYEEAIEFYSMAIELNGYDQEGYLGRAIANLSSGCWESCLEDARIVFDRDPSNLEALNLLLLLSEYNRPSGSFGWSLVRS